MRPAEHEAGTAVRWPRCAAVVLAGGRSTRMRGPDKLDADLGGRSVLEQVLAGVPPPVPVCVVGPGRALSRPVLTAREDPPLGGPAAAVAAGLNALLESGSLTLAAAAGVTGAAGGDTADLLVVLAGDAPWAPRVVPALIAALAGAGPRCPAAVAVDATGRRQPLLAVHRAADLDARTTPGGPQAMAGRPASWLVGVPGAVEVAVDDADTADVDTPEDLAAARRRGVPPAGDAGDAGVGWA